MSQKQEIFVNEYLKTGNASRAYEKAYGKKKNKSTTAALASRLLKNDNIMLMLKQKRKVIEKREGITRERIMKELESVAFANGTDFATIERGRVKIKDTDELEESTKKALSGVKETRYGIEIKPYDKIRALELLSKMMGYDKDSAKEDEQIRKLDEVLDKIEGVI